MKNKLSKYVLSIERENKVYLFNTKNNIYVSVDKKLIQKMKFDEKVRIDYELFLKKHCFYQETDELKK